jgi:hypothetical protein
MPTQTAGQLSARLRDAIAHRDRQRPGSPAHWRATCEVRVLQQQLVAALAGDGTAAPGTDHLPAARPR